MSEFTPINSQEELDKIISERIKRERESLSKKYADYDDIKRSNDERGKQLENLTKEMKDLSDKNSQSETTINELNSKIKGYDTDSVKTRIALELGLPYGMHSRLTGDDETSIRKDAEALKAMIGSNKPNAPRKDPETSGSAKSDMQNVLHDLVGKD